MKRLKIFRPVIVGLFFLVGCTTDETIETFYLTRVGIDSDPAIPQTYVVSPPEYKNKLHINYPYDVYTATDAYYEEYDLENVTVNEEEIILEFEGEAMRFNRLSSTVAETEGKIWYEYIVPDEKGGEQ